MFFHFFCFANSSSITDGCNSKCRIITTNKLRDPDTSFYIYRSFQILNQEFYFSVSEIVLPVLNLILILLPTACNFVVIRLHSQLALPGLIGLPLLSLSFISIVIFVFPFGASVNTSSQDYLNSFRGTLSEQLFKGCQPLKVRFGPLFFLQKLTVLKVISFIIYCTLRSMLIF